MLAAVEAEPSKETCKGLAPAAALEEMTAFGGVLIAPVAPVVL